MNILIIGGTAFIGYHVVRELIASGEHQITLFNRGNRKTEIPEGVNLIEGDRFKINEYRHQFEALTPDVVLHMVPIGQDDARLFMETMRDITPRVVGISSCDVYRSYDKLIGNVTGEPEKMPIREDDPLREDYFPYRKNPNQSEIMKKYDKILAEQQFMGDSDLSGTMLRLPIVYGERDYQHRMFDYLRRMDDGRPAILLNERHANWRISRAYARDVAHAISLAVTNPASANRIYNVAEKAGLTEVEWLQKIAQTAGWHGEIIRVPEALMPLDLDFAPEHEMIIDTTRIRQELGYAEQFPPSEAYQRTIEWERANPPQNVDEEQRRKNYAEEDEIWQKMKDSAD